MRDQRSCAYTAVMRTQGRHCSALGWRPCYEKSSPLCPSLWLDIAAGGAQRRTVQPTTPKASCLLPRVRMRDIGGGCSLLSVQYTDRIRRCDVALAARAQGSHNSVYLSVQACELRSREGLTVMVIFLVAETGWN